MVSIEECYKEIVGKNPDVDADTTALVYEILESIKRGPKSVNKQFANLFFVDLFESGWPSFCSIHESEAVMHEVIAAVQIYASVYGCINVEKMSVTQILGWVIKNVPID